MCSFRKPCIFVKDKNKSLHVMIAVIFYEITQQQLTSLSIVTYTMYIGRRLMGLRIMLSFD
jgi:hypothetical protein